MEKIKNVREFVEKLDAAKKLIQRIYLRTKI